MFSILTTDNRRGSLPRRAIAVAAIMMLINAGLPAQQRQERTSPAAEATSPGAVDTQQSRVYVFVDKEGFGHVHGVEGRVKSGTLNLDAMQDAGEIVFDMASFDADTDAALKYVGVERTVEESEKKKVTETMLGEEILNVEEHPTATFRIDAAKQLADENEEGHPQFELKGEFTLCGVTRPLTVVAAQDAQRDGKVHLRGEFTIKQTDFEIEPYSTGFGLASVADELRIWGDIWLVDATVVDED